MFAADIRDDRVNSCSPPFPLCRAPNPVAAQHAREMEKVFLIP